MLPLVLMRFLKNVFIDRGRMNVFGLLKIEFLSMQLCLSLMIERSVALVGFGILSRCACKSV
ncbi:hypothetical protein D3C81_1758860 [compost metagenome]